MKIHFDHLACLRGQRSRPEAIAGIRIEQVADKLRALRALEFPEAAHQLAANPRLAELLLFIQWLSQQPGGLEKGVRDRLLAAFPENVGTPELHAIEPERDGSFPSIEALVNIWSNLPERFRIWPAALGERHRDTLNLWLIEEPKRLRAIEREAGEQFRKITSVITPEYCWRLCADAASELLPRHLARLCNEPGHHFPDDREDKAWFAEAADCILGARTWQPEGQPGTSEPKVNRAGPRREVWYFRNLTETLFAMMDRHAVKVLGSIAQTQVARMIFDELDFAISSGVPVFISGDSRFGKTVVHRTWFDAYPGRGRIINTPPTGREWDFYTAHADALGIAYSSNANQRKLSRDVQFVIKHSGLFLCYDESHHLLPAKVSRTSKPWRMDWVRSHVIDCGIPAAFIATRQTYGKSLAQFVKVTQHQMEQWFDRMNRPLMLPGDISRKDVLAVAAHNFPTLPENQLETIASEAMKADSAFHAVTLLAKYATYLAKKADRNTPSDKDVSRAIAELKGRPNQKDFENPHAAPDAPACVASAEPSGGCNGEEPAPGAQAPSRPAAGPMQPVSTRPASMLQASTGREISPVNSTRLELGVADEAIAGGMV